MVKMNLDDSEGVNGADLGISFGEEGLIENREVLDQLRTGDHIQFEASLAALGDYTHLHHLHAWKVEKMSGKMDGIEIKVDGDVRYKLAPTHD